MRTSSWGYDVSIAAWVCAVAERGTGGLEDELGWVMALKTVEWDRS